SRGESRRLDALLVCDPRRSRTFRHTDRRSAPLQHRRARGVEAHVCRGRPCREAHTRQRSGRLPRGARVHRPAGGGRAMNPRIERLRELLEEPLLVTNPTNIHYLFGFKSACELTDRVFERLVEERFVGRTERDLAWTIEQLFHDEGAEAVAFETIVASGPNSARPHGRATDRLIGRGETVIVDTGCIV